MLSLSVIVSIISLSENSANSFKVSGSSLHWESHDGLWALNNLKNNTTEIAVDVRTMSPFDIADTENNKR